MSFDLSPLQPHELATADQLRAGLQHNALRAALVAEVAGPYNDFRFLLFAHNEDAQPLASTTPSPLSDSTLADYLYGTLHLRRLVINPTLLTEEEVTELAELQDNTRKAAVEILLALLDAGLIIQRSKATLRRWNLTGGAYTSVGRSHLDAAISEIARLDSGLGNLAGRLEITALSAQATAASHQEVSSTELLTKLAVTHGTQQSTTTSATEAKAATYASF